MGKFVDLTGQRFGRLTVIERDLSIPHEKGVHWKCRCDCGNFKSVKTSNLTKEYRGIKSCGCLLAETRTKDDFHDSKLYKIYHQIKYRCYNKNASDYEYYGGRGITMCDEWLYDGYSFYVWALSSGYRDGLTVDRIDVNGNYSPDNCRWITMKEQSNNRRSNHTITYNGKTQSLAKWAEELGMSYTTLRCRLNQYHMSVDEAFTRPIKSNKNNTP